MFMDIKKYPVPSDFINENMWQIFMEVVKLRVWERVKSEQLKGVGIETDCCEFFDIPFDCAENIMLAVFGITDEMRKKKDFDEIFEFYKTILKYTNKIIENELGIDDATYLCAKDIYANVEAYQKNND